MSVPSVLMLRSNIIFLIMFVVNVIHYYPLQSHAYNSVQDFCIADYKAPNGPAGYSCKNPANVSSNEFVFTGFRTPSNTSNPFRVGVTRAQDSTFPALNGLGLSADRVDMQPNSSVPLHSHPRASELLYVVRGKLDVGFISTNYTVYRNILFPGDIMVIPQGVLHFLINLSPDLPALEISFYDSPNSGLQILDFALFANNFTTSDITKTTFLSAAEVARLKPVFGGSG